MLAAELERVRVEYNSVRLHAAVGYVTPDDEHAGRGDAIRQARREGLARADQQRRAARRSTHRPERATMRADSTLIGRVKSDTPQIASRYATEIDEDHAGFSTQTSQELDVRGGVCPLVSVERGHRLHARQVGADWAELWEVPPGDDAGHRVSLSRRRSKCDPVSATPATLAILAPGSDDSDEAAR